MCRKSFLSKEVISHASLRRQSWKFRTAMGKEGNGLMSQKNGVVNRVGVDLSSSVPLMSKPPHLCICSFDLARVTDRFKARGKKVSYY